MAWRSYQLKCSDYSATSRRSGQTRSHANLNESISMNLSERKSSLEISLELGLIFPSSYHFPPQCSLSHLLSPSILFLQLVRFHVFYAALMVRSVLLHDGLLVAQVERKSNHGNAEPGENISESVDTQELALVSPRVSLGPGIGTHVVMVDECETCLLAGAGAGRNPCTVAPVHHLIVGASAFRRTEDNLAATRRKKLDFKKSVLSPKRVSPKHSAF